MNLLTQPTIETGREYPAALKQRRIKIALELIRQKKIFPFPGIKQDSYNSLKSEEEENLAHSGYAFTLIDEVLRELEQSGVEIQISSNQKDIYITPGGNPDNKSSTLRLHCLEIKEDMHYSLKQLLRLTSMIQKIT